MVVGCNPFSPELETADGSGNGNISDLTNPLGVFQNIQYSYTFKDTLIYSNLLNKDFTFTYRDYDQGFDVSWGREEEMRVTNGLFQNAQRLDLIWNNIISSTIDTIEATFIRGFNLTVTFNPSDIIRIDGRADLKLVKDSNTGRWSVIRWVDESNF